MKITRERDINQLSVERQLEFYKYQFNLNHCELEGCGNEVHSDWVIYNNNLYCDSCFMWLIQEEKENAEKQISEYESKIKEIKDRFNL